MRIKKHKNLLNHRSAPKGAQGVMSTNNPSLALQAMTIGLYLALMCTHCGIHIKLFPALTVTTCVSCS